MPPTTASPPPASTSRIKRTQKPVRKLKNWNLRERALAVLRLEFEERCAYSMQHVENAGGIEQMEIDHFDPRLKKRLWQRYDNLYLTKRACNLKKLSNWPTANEAALGIRFLDPCEEHDYGVHIFEDPVTHRLWGDTPAGKYHVRVLGLNSANLVQERKDRADLTRRLTTMPARVVRAPDSALVDTLAALRRQVERAIPTIAYRPEPAS